MPAGRPRLTSTGTAQLPAYTVTLDGRELGTVARTGSLPSCFRWWADGITGSFRTRALAVAALVDAHNSCLG